MTLLIVIAVKWYRKTSPNLNRHICLKQIGLSLRMYSNVYNGPFPAGKESPEASLSLLYTEGFLTNVEFLSGNSMMPEEAETVLKAGGLMNSEVCSWHYVEGLTENDDSDLAIMWDKVLGLGGRYSKSGCTEVLFINGRTEYIKVSEWQDFLKKQEELHKQKKQNK